MIPASKLLGPWTDHAQFLARAAMRGRPPTDRPVTVVASLLQERPQRLKARYPRRPDVDKALRAILDALSGIVYIDDSQVIVCECRKDYADRGVPGSTRIACYFLE